MGNWCLMRQLRLGRQNNVPERDMMAAVMLCGCVDGPEIKMFEGYIQRHIIFITLKSISVLG